MRSTSRVTSHNAEAHCPNFREAVEDFVFPQVSPNACSSLFKSRGGSTTLKGAMSTIPFGLTVILMGPSSPWYEILSQHVVFTSSSLPLEDPEMLDCEFSVLSPGVEFEAANTLHFNNSFCNLFTTATSSEAYFRTLCPFMDLLGPGIKLELANTLLYVVSLSALSSPSKSTALSEVLFCTVSSSVGLLGPST